MVCATISGMRLPLHRGLRIVCVALGVVWLSASSLGLAVQGQEELAAILLELMNETRLDEGLDPHGRSRLLTKAAQLHAEDVAENGLSDPDDVHKGSDGTDEQQRIEESGYAPWTLNGDRKVVGENVWIGRGEPEDALRSFLDDQAYRENLLSDDYREVGVGVATSADGGRVYVLDFGARPNVLPVFINDGTASTDNREVAVRLTNERVRPGGEGATFMGEAIEVRLSNEPEFEGLSWESWAPLVSWLLPDTSGDHTVYVQFRDAAGRTAASADGIFLDEGTPATPTSVPLTATLPLSPTPGRSSPTPAPGAGGTPGAATTSPEVTGTSEPRPTSSPSGDSFPSPTSFSGMAQATPFPTWTPLPSPKPTASQLNDSGEATLSFPSVSDYGRPLLVVGVLQGVVIVLGLYWVMRRGRGV